LSAGNRAALYDLSGHGYMDDYWQGLILLTRGVWPNKYGPGIICLRIV
jgi:hypothetical protein